MMHIPAVDQAFLLLLIVFCLGTCLVPDLICRLAIGGPNGSQQD